jgi:sialic acid synthase SpsE
MLERIGVDAYKIASGDVTFLPLIECCASMGKPLVISTGASTLPDVAAALDAARDSGARGVALLHCVSAYPVPSGSENLAAIATLSRVFGVPTGLSDHARDASSVALAVALGAALYERHIVLSANDDAVDAAVSSTPQALRAAVDVAALTLRAIGSGEKVVLPAEAHSLASRRGLYAARPLRAGDVVAAGDIIALRPANELTPAQGRALAGARLTRDVAAGAPFLASDLERVGVL